MRRAFSKHGHKFVRDNNGNIYNIKYGRGADLYRKNRVVANREFKAQRVADARARLDADISARQAPEVLPTPEPSRMAGEVIPEGLDQLLADVQSSNRDENFENLLENALQYTEQQAARPEVDIDALIAGTSKTAEQQIAKDLILKGMMPSAIPADLYRAQDLVNKSELGIAGPYQSDSLIKQSVIGGLDSDGELSLQHLPVRTEFLSSNTEEQLFNEWKKQQRPEQATRLNFNADVGEYYGQQALRLAGAKPVLDRDRSEKVVRGVRKDPGRRPEPLPPEQSTKGTDRLIENSVGILSPDIDFSGDYRYMMDGDVKVGDYQTGEVRDTIRLNVLKAVQGDGEDARTLKRNWAMTERKLAAQGIKPTPDRVIGNMVDQGLLPPIKRGKDGIGIRAGKSMSAHPLFKHQNNESQFRYDDILFGHTTPAKRHQARGYIPEELVLVDNAKALQAVGPSDVMAFKGSVNVVPQIDDLVAAGAAQRLEQLPAVRQLFG